jgi:hypothetical protein
MQRTHPTARDPLIRISMVLGTVLAVVLLALALGGR